MSYEIYKKLTEIYHVQETLKQNANEAGIMMSHMNVLSPFYIVGVELSKEDENQFSQIVKQGWVPIFEDFIYYESKLDTLYNEAITNF